VCVISYHCAQRLLSYTIQHRTVLSYPPDNHHSSDVVYWKAGEGEIESRMLCSCALVGHNHLGPFLRVAALRQHDPSTSSTSGRQDTRAVNLAVDWAWPEDVANPLSHLTLLTSVDLTANKLTHLGCDVMASLRSLSELVIADNLVSRLDDVSLQCAGPRLTRLDVSTNRLTQLTAQSLSSLPSVHSRGPLTSVQ